MAALTYLIIVSHSEKRKKKYGVSRVKVLIQFSKHYVHFRGGWGKVRHKIQKVTEGWEVLY